MEITRIHVDCTEMTTLEQIVNVVEEYVVSIHINNTLVVEHIPNVKLVQSILKMALVRTTAICILLVSTLTDRHKSYGFSMF